MPFIPIRMPFVESNYPLLVYYPRAFLQVPQNSTGYIKLMRGSEYSLDAGVEFIDHLVHPDESTFTNIPPMAPSEQLFRRALSLSASFHFGHYELGKHARTLHGYRIDSDLYRSVFNASAGCASVRGGGARFGRFEALWAAYGRYKQALEK
ncbi:hypothetical protein C8Q80DRAFT_1276497 [Daedaleopsis nitida]|nr:hypothetical protein C8Q80DRAFT_1276497 [Daedaleopsis nitida]